MRRSGRLFIILGVGLATLAVALAFLMFSGANSNQAAERAPAPVRIIVAAQDVPAHTKLQEPMLAEQQVDRDLLSGGEVMNKADVLGKAPKSGLVKGQKIIQSDLETPSLAHEMEPGKRGMPVPIDRFTGVGGLLRESDYIDVIMSMKVSLLYVLPTRPFELETTTAGDRTESATLPPTEPGDPAPYVYPGEPGSRFKMNTVDGNGDPLAKVVIQDVRVLRIVGAAPPPGQQPAAAQPPPAAQQQAAAAPADMVVLELTDEQAELMKFILDNEVSFSFVVRAKDDHETVTTNGITFDLLVTNHQLPTPKSVRLPGEKQP